MKLAIGFTILIALFSLFDGKVTAQQCVSNFGTDIVCAGDYSSVALCNVDTGRSCFESVACTACCNNNICPY